MTPHLHARRPFGRGALATLAFVAALGTFAHANPLAAAGAAPATTLDRTPAAAADATAPEQLRIVVNIPAYRVDAFLGGRLVASYPATMGMPREPTFAGRFTIDSVIWNPWWHPPAHRRPKEKVTPPGPRNPMGRVKLPLRGLYYIHGTAKDEEIGRPLSRGCVRLRNEDVLALTRLVHEHAGPLDPATLARLEASPRWTRRLPLERPVPVDIVYHVAEVRDGQLLLHPDVYRHESRPLGDLALDALARAGVDTSQLDAAAVARAAAGAESGTVAVAVTALMLGASPEAETPFAAVEIAGVGAAAEAAAAGGGGGVPPP